MYSARQVWNVNVTESVAVNVGGVRRKKISEVFVSFEGGGGGGSREWSHGKKAALRLWYNYTCLHAKGECKSAIRERFLCTRELQHTDIGTL